MNLISTIIDRVCTLVWGPAPLVTFTSGDCEFAVEYRDQVYCPQGATRVSDDPRLRYAAEAAYRLNNQPSLWRLIDDGEE